MITVTINGQAVAAREGQSVAAVLHINAVRVFRHTRFDNRPRALFCGIGACFDCIVTIDGRAHQRSCITLVRDGMVIETS